MYPLMTVGTENFVAPGPFVVSLKDVASTGTDQLGAGAIELRQTDQTASHIWALA
jgi:hypothetical protein